MVPLLIAKKPVCKQSIIVAHVNTRHNNEKQTVITVIYVNIGKNLCMEERAEKVSKKPGSLDESRLITPQSILCPISASASLTCVRLLKRKKYF